MKIEYENKVATRQSTLPRKNSITAEDLNEIKTSVNELYDVNGGYTVELIQAQTATFYAPENVKITEILSQSNESAVIFIFVNSDPYTLGVQINQFDEIKVTSDIAVVVNFATE